MDSIKFYRRDDEIRSFLMKWIKEWEDYKRKRDIKTANKNYLFVYLKWTYFDVNYLKMKIFLFLYLLKMIILWNIIFRFINIRNSYGYFMMVKSNENYKRHFHYRKKK